MFVTKVHRFLSVCVSTWLLLMLVSGGFLQMKASYFEMIYGISSLSFVPKENWSHERFWNEHKVKRVESPRYEQPFWVLWDHEKNPVCFHPESLQPLSAVPFLFYRQMRRLHQSLWFGWWGKTLQIFMIFVMCFFILTGWIWLVRKKKVSWHAGCGMVLTLPFLWFAVSGGLLILKDRVMYPEHLQNFVENREAVIWPSRFDYKENRVDFRYQLSEDLHPIGSGRGYKQNDKVFLDHGVFTTWETFAYSIMAYHTGWGFDAEWLWKSVVFLTFVGFLTLLRALFQWLIRLWELP